jgi:dihydroorotate dehydrogenase
MYRVIRPLLFLLPPELAHGAAMAALRLGRPLLPALRGLWCDDDPRLAVTVAGLRFPNPIGLAAGFDKAAQAVDAWEHLGFGFAEIGTLTRHPQPGNPKPRVWRYVAQRALINRFGFNNPGADVVAERLRRLRQAGRWPAHPVGINLGKSKVTPLEAAVEDYLYSLDRLRDFADYIALNVSSPNTPGLRRLQGVAPIRALVAAVAKALRGSRARKASALPKRPLLFVKFAPDLAPKALLASVDAALEAGADGLILTNTTLAREGLPPGPHPEGGLSGQPLRTRADAALARVARHTRGRVPLIGVGGILTAEDVRRKLDLGATLVQIYTGFIYGGPATVRTLCQALKRS